MAGPAALKRAMASIITDVRFEQLHPEVQTVWYHFYGLSILQTEPGRVLSIEPFVPYFARRLGVEPEGLGEDLERLADCGFLELDEDGRGASLPGIVWRGNAAALREAPVGSGQPQPGLRRPRSPAQIAASRNNGRMSAGRPKTRDRRQGEILLPSDGGRVQASTGQLAEPARNPPETQERNPSAAFSGFSQVSAGFGERGGGGRESPQSLENPPPPHPLSDSRANPSETREPSPETQGTPSAEDDGAEVARAAAQVARFLGIGRPEPRVVASWLADGANLEDIESGMAALTASGKREKVIHSASYLTRWVMGPVAARRATSSGVSATDQAAEDAYQAACRLWGRAVERSVREGTPHPGPRPVRGQKAA